jgi:UDP-N-acetylglucosamine 2-epimerase (non-hydrolysing)
MISIVIGARPEFIQSSPVIRELIKNNIQFQLIHTGQHYDYMMNKIFYDELKIPNPSINLEVGSGSHATQTGEMLKRVEQHLLSSKPSIVVVFGDTNSTLAGALAGVKENIPIGHVESGMRSYDRTMPEEINRVLVDHCSDVLFCSTKSAIQNLKKEGITKNVYFSGDVTIDALRYNEKISDERSHILETLDLIENDYYIVTLHRKGNVENNETLKRILNGIVNIDDKIIFPLHPRTRNKLKELRLYDSLKNKIDLIDPLGYYDFIKLLKNSKKVITDSGGIQKEAYILKKPCITIRNTTEWIETVEDGWNILVGDNPDLVTRAAKSFIPAKTQSNIFGYNASKKIVKILLDYI